MANLIADAAQIRLEKAQIETKRALGALESKLTPAQFYRINEHIADGRISDDEYRDTEALLAELTRSPEASDAKGAVEKYLRAEKAQRAAEVGLRAAKAASAPTSWSAGCPELEQDDDRAYSSCS